MIVKIVRPFLNVLRSKITFYLSLTLSSFRLRSLNVECGDCPWNFYPKMIEFD